MLDSDLLQRHLEFLGDQHRNSRLDTLTHLDLRIVRKTWPLLSIRIKPFGVNSLEAAAG
jgi:hypothetical protein